MMDKLEITILEDGTIKVDSDKVSGANHQNAEQFFQLLARNAGGLSQRERNPKHAHGQVHSHTHTHDSITHKH